ncbi:hypothetical protein B0T25DRAFT_520859 [Lasiosphaeria hispida]|uniref:Uncharacterized protein n=1 Tax=Lasiosphaeria hispida TaxID=260671 RepID=A0AAJ0HBF0_9PEZI|nr:hypothetical protein B0T25DRAFT_520859 [Lasiosphaeria hispida]
MSSIVPRLVGELTVGHVAGIIAACVVVIRFSCPAVLTYVLAGLLRDTETASTWTVANASLQASVWPTILRTDSTGSGGTARTLIRVTCKALPLMAVFGAITGIVTPLGLGEESTTLPARAGTFEYIKDDSAYGLGTSDRGQYPPSRICPGEHQNRPAKVGTCPYSNSEVVFIDSPDGDGFAVELPKGYNTSVPDEAREIFSSGTGNSTVSNFFDIEWRQLSSEVDPDLGDAKISVGMFRPLDSSILDNKYKVIEGLVVDAISGGIGFRNHTIPTGLSRGATWEEDILFVEPLTACVNTNLTLDFEMALVNDGSAGNIANLLLTDRGGFSHMNTTLPPLLVLDGQTDPELQQRAYKAAWLNNAFTMLYLNVTNEKDKPRQGMKSFSYMDSTIGKGFPVPRHSSDGYEFLQLSTVFGNYFHLTSSSGTVGGRNYSNPFNVSQAEFNAINTICAGTIPANPVNITNIYVGCGLLRGAPKRTDGGSPLLFESGSKWSSPLHTCASSVRATIKTVRFLSNSTGLVPLEVLAITPKTYTDEADAPLWGLEDWGFRLNGFNPMWGLLSPEYATRRNVTTVRKPDFNLIGTSNGPLAPTLNLGAGDNLAGADFAQYAMNTVYLSVATSAGSWPIDLRGAASMSVFRRWQTMSQDAASAGGIINLMWTDVAASAVVGTRGVLGDVNSGTRPAGEILVQPIGNRITFDARFGIPAAVLVVWLGVIVLVALLSTCCCGGRAGVKTLRRRIEQLSVGRVFTTFLYPQDSTLTMPAKHWRVSNGLKTITVDAVARGAGEELVYARSGQEGSDTYGLIDRQKR